jgi:hypothetical protein
MASTSRKPRLEIPNCTAEEKRAALDQVLQSNTFERADLLRRFLRYICEMEIVGRAYEINEYTIATDALGRPATYSPGEDSSVRSRAHAVREKLAAFYESEGAEAPLRIELHKGSYIPHFASRAESERRAELPPPALPPSRIVPTATRGFAAGVILTAILAVLAFLLLSPVKVRSSAATILREFWGPLLQPGNGVILCIATAPSMLLHSYQDGTLPPEPRIFRTPPEVAKWYDDLHMLDNGGRLYAQTSQNTILFGDNLAATPFSVRYDPVTKLEVISTEGSTGEPGVVYSSQRNAQSGGGGLKLAYGLITVAPGPPTGDESGHRIVLISGISSAGTQAAMEFFC